jgi:hypothetical protein
VNGKRGDHPITDIVNYRVAVFGPAIDLLIAEIIALGGRQELEDRYGPSYWPPPSFEDERGSPIAHDLESQLRSIRDRHEENARAAGWEVDRLLEEA